MTSYIDITLPVTDKLVCWSDRTPPEHRWERRIDLGEHCNTSFWGMSAHAGTHMDAPLHFVDGGTAIDQVRPEVFIGECVVVDLQLEGTRVMGDALASRHQGEKRLLLKTQQSYSDRHGAYVPHECLLTSAAATILLDGGLALIGTDRLSVDDSEGKDYSFHHLLLGAGCVLPGV